MSKDKAVIACGGGASDPLRLFTTCCATSTNSSCSAHSASALRRGTRIHSPTSYTATGKRSSTYASCLYSIILVGDKTHCIFGPKLILINKQ